MQIRCSILADKRAMTVTFSKTIDLSPDGVTVKRYEQGSTYKATGTHEIRQFKRAVENGFAVAGTELPKTSAKRVTKVAKPQATK